MAPDEFQRFRTPYVRGHLLIRQLVSSQTNYFGDDPVDPQRYLKAKLAQFYHLRWQATEVNLAPKPR